MLSSFERLLIWRYLLPRGEGRIVVLVAAIGMTAVAIGVASLIVVMSLMNGVRTKLSIQFAGVNGHASISRPGERMADWRMLKAEALREPAVLAAVPALDAAAMAAAQGRVVPAAIRGMEQADMAKPLPGRNDPSFFGALPAADDQVIVGTALADSLGLSIGSSMTLMRPALDRERSLSVRSSSVVVAGLIETGIGKYDQSIVIMRIGAAQQVAESGDSVSRINLSTASAERAGETLAPLKQRLRGKATLQTWRELNKPIFDALALEKVGMFIAISMVVLVALFNILSSLAMLVGSKVRDIAILRTMGASRASIMRMFVAVGTAIGSCGAAAGALLGFLLLAAKARLATFAEENLLGSAYADEVAVLVDLPTRIGAAETAGILAMALLGTILTTLYPAYRAANVDPATVLRYE